MLLYNVSAFPKDYYRVSINKASFFRDQPGIGFYPNAIYKLGLFRVVERTKSLLNSKEMNLSSIGDLATLKESPHFLNLLTEVLKGIYLEYGIGHISEILSNSNDIDNFILNTSRDLIPTGMKSNISLIYKPLIDGSIIYELEYRKELEISMGTLFQEVPKLKNINGKEMNFLV
jgi:hypothetical protein